MTTDCALRLDQPAVYEIHVQGGVGDCWAEWFNGLSITRQGGESPDEPEQLAVTIFTGTVADQAALLGLLLKLYHLRHPLLLVRRVENGSSDETPMGQLSDGD